MPAGPGCTPRLLKVETSPLNVKLVTWPPWYTSTFTSAVPVGCPAVGPKAPCTETTASAPLGPLYFDSPIDGFVEIWLHPAC